MSLDDILADVEAGLEVIVELDSANRSAGTLATWYYSTHGRATGAAETPANTEMPAFLVPGGTLGPLAQSLGEDAHFSGFATEDPGSITLLQPRLDVDMLSQLANYTFAGYEVRIKIGRTTDAIASFETFRTTTAALEPEIALTSEGLQATIQLAGVLGRMLDENLIVDRYVGLPHAIRFITVSGAWAAGSVAAYDVTSFTIMLRFKASSFGTNSLGALLKRRTSSTACQFQIALYHSSAGGGLAGKLQVDVSIGAVEKNISGVSSSTYLDGEWHELIFSLQDRTRAYYMVDGDVIGTPADSSTLTGSVDLPAAGVICTGCFGADMQDWRFYNRYMPENEARGLFSIRADGDDLGVIGMWRADDNTGGTLNDYSATANDGGLTGTINVDYSWQPSDLGGIDLAGRPMPIAIGDVLNFPAHLMDTDRERYRISHGASLGTANTNQTIVVRSRGTTLTGGGTDYTISSSNAGEFVMTAAEDEPVTVDVQASGTSEESFYVSGIVNSLLLNRTRITSSQIADRINPLTVLCPWLAGYWTENDSTAKEALEEILGQSGLCYYEDVRGKLYPDMLLPPMGYGPYGEPCLDLRGGLNNGVSFGDLADAASSMTVACWFKTAMIDQTGYNWGSSEPNAGTFYLVAKANTGGNYALYFQGVGSDAGKLKFRTAGTTLATAAGLIEASTWYFVAAVFDDTGNTQKLYVGKLGGTLLEVASGANTGTPTTGSSALMIGGSNYPWGSVQHAQVWTTTKSLAQLQALMATPPVGNEANLAAYIPANEGEGAPVEKVSTMTGTLSGTAGNLAVWAPRFTINLNDTPSVKLVEFRHVAPAPEIIVRYARNRKPMTDADIDTGVTQSVRLDLRREWKDIPSENADDRTRFKSGRRIILDSPLVDRESAQRLVRALATRFATDRYVGRLRFAAGDETGQQLVTARRAVGLGLTEEIGLQGTIPSQIATARSFRVVAVSPNPLQLTNEVMFWG